MPGAVRTRLAGKHVLIVNTDATNRRNTPCRNRRTGAWPVPCLNRSSACTFGRNRTDRGRCGPLSQTPSHIRNQLHGYRVCAPIRNLRMAASVPQGIFRTPITRSTASLLTGFSATRRRIFFNRKSRTALGLIPGWSRSSFGIVTCPRFTTLAFIRNFPALRSSNRQENTDCFFGVDNTNALKFPEAEQILISGDDPIGICSNG